MVNKTIEFLKAVIRIDGDSITNLKLTALRILIYRNIKKRFEMTLEKLPDLSNTVFSFLQNESVEDRREREEKILKFRATDNNYKIIANIVETKISDIKEALKILDNQMSEEQTSGLAEIFFQEMIKKFKKYQEESFNWFMRSCWPDIYRPKEEYEKAFLQQDQQGSSRYKDPIWHWAQRNKELLEI